jgi:HEPN domain-containing protein
MILSPVKGEEFHHMKSQEALQQLCYIINMEEQRWLGQAEKDLESARDSGKAGHFEWACFQSQQAAEKGLKGFLYSKGLRAILTHSIRELVLDCSKYESSFSDLLSQAKTLDTYYIPTRYPNGLVGNEIPAQYYSEEDASQCISYAGLILKTVKRFMSS